MNDLALQMRKEQAQLPLLFEACIEQYLKEIKFRCYMYPSEFSKYAKTFKIKPTKRSKRK
jgi:hypothetical protein